MKFLCGIIFLTLSLSALAQKESYTIYTLEEALLTHPDSVYAIDLSRKKIIELPKDLYRFRELKFLNLSKNKLSLLSDSFAVFSHLETLTISSNKFESLPAVLFKLRTLRYLFAAKNEITSIQNEIQYMQALEEIDLYDNPISSIGTGLQQLKMLKKLDLQGVMYGPTFHNYISQSLPNVKVKMDPPCNCME